MKQKPHTEQISWQNHKAWSTDPSPAWQRQQTEEGTIPRLCKLSIVGMESVQACQRKNFTLFGIFSFQSLFQNFFYPAVSEDEATSFSYKSQSKWYPERTWYMPIRERGQNRKSFWVEWQTRMDLICWASEGIKIVSTRLVFHHRDSLSNS